LHYKVLNGFISLSSMFFFDEVCEPVLFKCVWTLFVSGRERTFFKGFLMKKFSTLVQPVFHILSLSFYLFSIFLFKSLHYLFSLDAIFERKIIFLEFNSLSINDSLFECFRSNETTKWPQTMMRSCTLIDFFLSSNDPLINHCNDRELCCWLTYESVAYLYKLVYFMFIKLVSLINLRNWWF